MPYGSRDLLHWREPRRRYFNLIAHNSYKHIPNYRDLTAVDDFALYEKSMNRVSDTFIPEDEAIRKLEKAIVGEWISADKSGAHSSPLDTYL